MGRLTKSQCRGGGLPKKKRRHGEFAELKGGEAWQERGEWYF